MKIVVFDLDETLGYFTQYGIFWDSLVNYVKSTDKPPMDQILFNYILDLYPEFLRPNIINILTYLKNKKKTKCCHKMMIYTNNTGPREWAQNIIAYFEAKIRFKLVDQIIAAFKINGKQIEICRTTQNKTHNDLIRCTKIPPDAEICFMDDSFYPDMTNDKIYYINIKPYYYDLDFKEMLVRFKRSKTGMEIIQNDPHFDRLMMEQINLYKYVVIEKEKKEYEVDKILGKHIISHLHTFFSRSSKNKTCKNRGHKKNRTVKHHN